MRSTRWGAFLFARWYRCLVEEGRSKPLRGSDTLRMENRAHPELEGLDVRGEPAEL